MTTSSCATRSGSADLSFSAVRLLMGLVVIVLSSASDVSAEEFRPKDGVYIGLAMPFVTIGNDFDGETVFVGDSDVVLVPKLEGAFGLKVSLGVRFSNVAMDLNYLRSSHDASVVGIPGDAKYQQFGGDLKLLLAQQQAQPYILVGFYLAEVVLKDGSATGFGDVGDASYQGLGFNAGVGLLYNLHPRFALDIGVLYRLGLFTSAKGAAGTRETLDPTLTGGGVGVNIGGAFTF